MTQSQLITYLADEIGVTKTQAKAALDELNTLVTRARDEPAYIEPDR